MIRLRALKPALVIVPVALGCLPPNLASQAATAPTQQTPSPQQAPPQMGDPTRPEIQPSLSIDRDPVPSPDPEQSAAAPTSAEAPARTGAQAGAIEKRQDGVYTLHEDVDEVLLSCAVVDDQGRPVLDLTKNDFRIWEDGVPQVARSFLHQDLPVSMGVLVDNSGSMRDKRMAVTMAVMKLLRESNPKDSAFIVNFSDRAYLDQGFTSDLEALNRGLSRFDTKGTTALYDAVAASAEELSKNAKQAKQVLLIITDGADNASRLDLNQAIRRVKNLGGPVVYAVGLLYDAEPQEVRRSHEALEILSRETGGVSYFPRSIDEVDHIAEEVAQDIRNQYTIGYSSTKPSSLGGFRTVRVEAISPNGRRKLTVRTRNGYYANSRQRTQAAQSANRQPAGAQPLP